MLLETSQYSVTEYAMPLVVPRDSTHAAVRRDPFVDLVYDLSPIVMHIHESPLGVLHFLVRLCAVVGGAVSVTRLLDRIVHGAVRAFGLWDGRRSSAGGSGGGGGSYGGGGGGGLLPTRSGSHHGSQAGNGGLRSTVGGSLLRHSSNGSGPLPGPGSLRPSYSGGGGAYSGGGGGAGGLGGYGSGSLQPSYLGGGMAGSGTTVGAGGGYLGGGLAARTSTGGGPAARVSSGGPLSQLGGGGSAAPPPLGGYASWQNPVANGSQHTKLKE
jgi:hypothetical protein